MKTIYGLVGRHLGHSWSRNYFTDRFAREGVDAAYLNFEMEDPVAELPQLIADTPALSGLNVTVPYKQTVMPLLDEISPEAEAIGAVNVIAIERSDAGLRLTGHNTDCLGFRESLRPLLGDATRHTRALVLGTGGASLAVCHALRQLGIEPQRVSRHSGPDTLTYDELTPGIVASHTVIVNTTPCGMWPDTGSQPPFPTQLVGSGHICYDLVYNPSPTAWLKACAARGAVTTDGLAMLRLQADASLRLWRRSNA